MNAQMQERRPAGTVGGGRWVGFRNSPSQLAVQRGLIEAPEGALAMTVEQLRAINEPYEELQPPIPVSAQQVFDFWSHCKLEDENIAAMQRWCRLQTPAFHSAYAIFLYRIARMVDDAGLLIDLGKQSECDALMETTMEGPAGRVTTIREAVEKYRLESIRDRGVIDAVRALEDHTVELKVESAHDIGRAVAVHTTERDEIMGRFIPGVGNVVAVNNDWTDMRLRRR